MEENAQTEETQEQQSQPEEKADGRKTAIIVDDSSFMRKVLTDFISEQGVEVAGQASDGKSGYELFEQTNPDIMFIDIMMPLQDGLDTLKEIKKKNPWAKVIIMTSLDPEQAKQRAKDLGAWDYLTKPIDREKVIELLKKI